jgi:mannosylglucosylglycerate synthase
MSRVGIVHYTASPAIGGIERIIDAQAAALRDAGHSVTVIAGNPEARDEGWYTMHSLLPGHAANFTHLEPLNGRLPALHHPLVMGVRKSIDMILRRYDLICVHNLLSVDLNPYASVALYRAIKNGRPELWSIWCEDISIASQFVEHRNSWFDLRALRRPGVGFVTISEYRAAQIEQYFGIPREEIDVVSPPIAGSWLNIGDEAAALAERLNLMSCEPIVLVPSKLLPHKGLERAVELAGELQRTFPDSTVLVTGAPSDHQPELSAKVLDRLQHTAIADGVKNFHVLSSIAGRPIGPKTVRDLMMISDVVYVPSAEEGFGLPVIEAAAIRVPVICSDIPTLREAGEGYATFVPVTAPSEDVAAAVAEIAGHPTTAARRQARRSGTRFRAEVLQLMG